VCAGKPTHKKHTFVTENCVLRSVFYINQIYCSESNVKHIKLRYKFISEHPDDLEILSARASADDVFFDSVIGHIEDIFMGKNIIHNVFYLKHA
jgi:hypothetical protein